jgi:hypothetical protein
MYAILIALITMTASLPALAACGEKGGPGYRGPNGKCVGWAQIGRVCGTPPETRCTPEIAHPDAGTAATKGGEIQQMMDSAHRAVEKKK